MSATAWVFVHIHSKNIAAIKYLDDTFGRRFTSDGGQQSRTMLPFEAIDRSYNDIVELQKNGDELDCVLIRAFLDVCATVGRADVAEKVLGLAESNKNFHPSAFEYGLIIKCYSQNRDLRSALNVLNRIHAQNEKTRRQNAQSGVIAPLEVQAENDERGSWGGFPHSWRADGKVSYNNKNKRGRHPQGDILKRFFMIWLWCARKSFFIEFFYINIFL